MSIKTRWWAILALVIVGLGLCFAGLVIRFDSWIPVGVSAFIGGIWGYFWSWKGMKILEWRERQ